MTERLDPTPKFDTYIISDMNMFERLVSYEKNTKSDILVIDVEADSVIDKLANLYGIGLCLTDKKAFYIRWRDDKGNLIWKDEEYITIVKWLSEIIRKRKLIGHNLVYDVLVLENSLGIDIIPYIYSDTILQKHALNEEPPFALKEIAKIELGDWADKAQEKLKGSVLKNGGVWKRTQKDIYKADIDILGEYCCWDVIITRMLFDIYEVKLQEEGLIDLFYNDEIIPQYKYVTIPMKKRGFPINVEYFEGLKLELDIELNRLEDIVMTCIKQDVSEFENKKLEEDYPVNNKGNYPVALAEILGIPLPMKKNKKGETKVTLAAKAIEAQEKACPQFSTFYQWVSGKTSAFPGTDKNMKDAQLNLYFKENPDKRYIFNLNSGDHIGYLLFDILKFPVKKYTDGGKSGEKKPSTNAEVIDELIEQYKDSDPWLNDFLDYRKLKKLQSTYVEGVLSRHINGVIYTNMLQFGTTSGRYASRDPNLQNQPRLKDEDSGLSALVLKYVNAIRKGFIAGEGKKIVAADYASLEPRCFCHVSGDKNLQNVFIKGEDLYSRIAIDVFKLDNVSANPNDPHYLKKVQPEFRQKAKVFCLAVVYGAEESRISNEMKVDWKEAKMIIMAYLRAYPGLRRYMAICNQEAKLKGISRTEFGRIRHIKEASDYHILYGNDLLDYKWASTRGKKYLKMRRKYKNLLNNAKNFPIQGLAAHIINRALIATAKRFALAGINAYVALQVHDEGICIADEKDANLAAEILKDCMENTTKLTVPLPAEPVIADNWADAK